MKRVARWVYNAGRRIALSFATLFVIVLNVAILRGYGTIGATRREFVELHNHSPLSYLLIVVVGLGLMGLIWVLRRIRPALVYTVLLAAWGAFVVALAATTKVVFRADAYHVVENSLVINAGNIKSLGVGGYFGVYPHQLGLASFERLSFKLLGITTLEEAAPYMVGVNIVATIVTITCLWLAVRTWAQLGLSPQARHNAGSQPKSRTGRDVSSSARGADSWMLENATLLLSFSFLPAVFFVLFVYNVVIGTGFFSLGVLLISRIFAHFTSHGGAWSVKQILSVVVASFSVGMAVLLRSNFMIGMVALACIMILAAINPVRLGKTRRPVVLITTLLMLACGLALPAANKAHYASYPEADLEHAQPSLVWVEMGLRDTNENDRQPGWFSAAPRAVYGESGFDSEAAEAAATENIAVLLDRYRQSPGYAAQIAGVKFRTTWTEATLQSVWSGPVGEKGSVSSIVAFDRIYQGGRYAYGLIQKFATVWLVLAYLGLAVATLRFWQPSMFKRVRERGAEIVYFPLVYLVGGVLFHVVWETKSQYVYAYIAWLIPLAALGWVTITQTLSGKFNIRTKS